MRKTSQQAVALRYESEDDRAPQVVAKGEGLIAEKIIAAAQQHGVPLLRDPVSGQLLGQVDIGTEIPSDFYQIVAEILAFVYQLEERHTIAEQ